MRRALAALALFGCGSSPAPRPATCTRPCAAPGIYVTVRDGGGALVAQPSFALGGQALSAEHVASVPHRARAATACDCWFVFPVPDGASTLVVSAPGRAPRTAPFDVGPGDGDVCCPAPAVEDLELTVTLG